MFSQALATVNNGYTSLVEKYQKILNNKPRPYVWGYARLSRDDDKEQNSLTNQKKIILDFAKENEYDIIDIFEDDNITGMTFDRDGISDLKDIVDAGLADIIIVKDLSRLGRIKSYSALFVDYLRMKEVKLISATENVDSSNENDDLIIGIKQILNEQYSKDLSRKIRSAFKQKQKEGLVIIPPFGYYKDKNTGEITIVEECAEIVRLIFKLYLDGLGAKKIATYLTKNGYKPPAYYQKKLLGKNVPKNKTKYAGKLWYDRTVSQILKNDAYIGTLRCRTTSRSVIYKTKKRLSEEEHIIHENFYPSIIDMETWKMTQAVMENRSKNKVKASNNSKIHRYAGLLECNECGAVFVAVKRKSNKGEYIEYICNTYHRRGRQFCSSHRIREEYIDDVIYSYLENLKDMAHENLIKVDEFLKDWNERKREYNKSIDKIQEEIIELKEEIKGFSKQLAKNLISEELFLELTQDNNLKMEMLNKQIESLREVQEISKNAKKNMKSSIQLLDDIIEQRELSDAQLQMIVKKIKISEIEDGKFNLSVNLNTPFKYHVNISDYFTQPKHVCEGSYSVVMVNLINLFANIAEVAE